MNYFSTGEVSKQLNVSLRTLRYYDQIGLVKPAHKDEHGKRYYTAENILLLQKILLLKATSMPLKDIQNIISQITTEKTLKVHKQQLEHEITHLERSLEHTNTLFNILKLEGQLQWDHLLPLFMEEDQSEKEQRKQEVMEALFNEEEQETLQEQLPKMEQDPDQMAKWINIIKRIELCLEEGKTPDSKHGQLIAHDTIILSDETFNGDTALAEKFWEARKSEETSADLNLYPVSKEVMRFMEEAIVSYERNGIPANVN
ncbi:MerR family transcriptional regulator [Sediminibacillus massiliensis]|uniref:MerR family transcriptional regulator n=1 Tax=Sediminibacillus massiliensis TaxID=1926277 RepID=UPI0009884C5B|nr:MerR family transcriptional regulator [Sediminibacillus massiliensis]